MEDIKESLKIRCLTLGCCIVLAPEYNSSRSFLRREGSRFANDLDQRQPDAADELSRAEMGRTVNSRELDSS